MVGVHLDNTRFIETLSHVPANVLIFVEVFARNVGGNIYMHTPDRSEMRQNIAVAFFTEKR